MLKRGGMAEGQPDADEFSASRDRHKAKEQIAADHGVEDLTQDAARLHLLVVDADEATRTACLEIAEKMSFVVLGVASAAAARDILRYQKVDLLLLDLKTLGNGDLSLLEEVKTLYPDTAVVVTTASASIASAVDAMRLGAMDYLTKPFALEEFAAILERAGERQHHNLESRRLREKLRTHRGFGRLVGGSPEMEKLYRILSKVAFSMHPVLVLGESGTGKELVARAIHFNGPLANKAFTPVDCGSLAPELLEAELFGYVKGAFPGAHRNKTGLLADANGGTLFLDEISELPLDLQAKLLRALQDRTVRPLGSNVSVPVSARVLAATSRDLWAMVEQGRFRNDLYFRLNVVNLRIPPLRDRKEDIPALAKHFLDRVEIESGVAQTLSDNVLRAMMSYDWPGNVRELEGAIQRACSLSSGPVLHMGDLPTQLHAMAAARRVEAVQEKSGSATGEAAPAPILSIAELEKQAILNTLRQLKGDKLMVAKLLGIGKTTLYRKLKEYGVTDELEE